ncbi:MAG: sigma-54 dependent transcriptional regulator [Saprospiraceae bacterium]|nr:sigma-54-dependent Fis family transcriptional regulator [Lewinella sp.]
MSKKNPHILIVDDIPDFHQEIRYAFRKGYSFEGAIGVRQLRDKLRTKEHFDLILLDLVLEQGSEEKIGLELIHEIKESRPGVPIIVVTGEHDYKTAADSISRGAQHFLYKGDYKFEEWEALFRKVIGEANLKDENKKLKKKVKELEIRHEFIQHPDYPIIGSSPQMERLRRSLKIAADKGDLTVLITGETGVGKSIAAHSLHYNSILRSEHPFEEIFISNIAETMLEAELFGSKKGSYTDSKEDRIGRLQLADKGIVFLDEIGDLDPNSQGKLLQFLQNKTIRPLGARKDVDLDVQVVAATNKVMKEEVDEGRFRRDLYERLKVFPLEIPPLRERRADIGDLLLHFLKLNTIQQLQEVFTPEVINILLKGYDWKGNVRELQHAVTSMKLKRELEGVSLINLECLPNEIRAFGQQYTKLNVASPPNGQLDGHTETEGEALPDMSDWPVKMKQEFDELQQIERALIRMNGVKQDAADTLGYNSSDDIRYRVQKMIKTHPGWMAHFPRIQRSYKKYMKS